MFRLPLAAAGPLAAVRGPGVAPVLRVLAALAAAQESGRSRAGRCGSGAPGQRSRPRPVAMAAIAAVPALYLIFGDAARSPAGGLVTQELSRDPQ